MEDCKIKKLYNLDETIAKELLEKFTYPWEVLPHIEEFIIEIGNRLNPNVYEKKGENIWIAKSAKVYPTAYINGPAIIGEDAEVRHCAFIRGKAIVGNGAVVAWERTTHGGKNDTGGGILRHGSRRQRRKRMEKVPEKAALAGKRAKGWKKM